MTFNPSVKLTRLYETTSKSGNVYLRGRLGFANIVILKSEQVSDSGQPIWNVLISEPEERNGYTPRTGKPDHQSPGDDAPPRSLARSGLDDEIPF